MSYKQNLDTFAKNKKGEALAITLSGIGSPVDLKNDPCAK